MITVSRIRRTIGRAEAAIWNRLIAPRLPVAPTGRVYDIGMHSGADTAYYLLKGFTVIGVDANPTMIRAAEKRFAAPIGDGRLQLVCSGISAQNSAAPAPFFVNQHRSEWSSFDRSLAERRGDPISVEHVASRSLSSVVEQFGPAFYVKIDIEGQDRVALASLLEAGHRPPYVSVENGGDGILQLLIAAGYTGFKYIQQRDAPHWRLPVPTKHGNSIKQRFRIGDSGRFGEETAGRKWLTAAAGRETIQEIWDNPDRDERTDG